MNLLQDKSFLSVKDSFFQQAQSFKKGTEPDCICLCVNQMNIPAVEICSFANLHTHPTHQRVLELSYREICYEFNVNGKDEKSIKLKGLNNN